MNQPACRELIVRNCPRRQNGGRDGNHEAVFVRQRSRTGRPGRWRPRFRSRFRRPTNRTCRRATCRIRTLRCNSSRTAFGVGCQSQQRVDAERVGVDVHCHVPQRRPDSRQVYSVRAFEQVAADWADGSRHGETSRCRSSRRAFAVGHHGIRAPAGRPIAAATAPSRRSPCADWPVREMPSRASALRCRCAARPLPPRPTRCSPNSARECRRPRSAAPAR